MYVIANIGKFTALPPIALHIYNKDMVALEQSLTEGWATAISTTVRRDKSICGSMYRLESD